MYCVKYLVLFFFLFGGKEGNAFMHHNTLRRRVWDSSKYLVLLHHSFLPLQDRGSSLIRYMQLSSPLTGDHIYLFVSNLIRPQRT